MVEYGAPNAGVGGSSPSTPAKVEMKIMFNPLRFIQSVKQEAFKVSWPTGRDVLIGTAMVFVLASIAAVFFLLLDQIYRVLLDLILTINI